MVSVFRRQKRLKLSCEVDECLPLVRGGRRHLHGATGVRSGGGPPGGCPADQGEAVQVGPIKPTLKAPGTKRSKPEYDEPLSNIAFKFNVRRYIEVRRCRFDPIKCESNAPGTKRLKLNYDILLSSFAFYFNLRHYTGGRLPAQMPGADSTTQAVQYVHDCKDLWLDHPEYEVGWLLRTIARLTLN